jgi:Fe-S-cluster containining protein
MPDDVENIRRVVGVEVDNCFERDSATGALRPKIVSTRYGYSACVFLTLDRNCSIHAVKPYECRETHHTLSPDQLVEIQRRVAREWK